MGIGGDILFSVDELVRLVRVARGQIVLNHLEALDHCPTTRRDLRARMRAEGLGDRVHVPEDGEALVFLPRDGRRTHASALESLGGSPQGSLPKSGSAAGAG